MTALLGWIRALLSPTPLVCTHWAQASHGEWILCEVDETGVVPMTWHDSREALIWAWVENE